MVAIEYKSIVGMSVRGLVSVYLKATFILLTTLILLKEGIIFYHREVKIA